MAKKIYRKCICCGKEYEYCNHCGKGTEPWKNLYDSKECQEVMNIVSAYNIGRADANQVKAVLDKYNVTDYNKYKDSINAVLNSLFAFKASEPEIIPESNDAEEKPSYYDRKKPWKKNYNNVDVDFDKSDEASS